MQAICLLCLDRWIGTCCTDIASVFGARTDRDVNVEVRRVVMNAVGVADRIIGMKSLVELRMTLFIVE